MANLRLVCRTAMDVTDEQIKFMNERVAALDGRWDGELPELTLEKEKVYADYALLRTTPLKAFSFEDWARFLDRRWNQYADVGFTYSPTETKWAAWKEFWKGRIEAQKVAFHTDLLAYSDSATQATKQKLRVLAEKAHQAEKVLRCGVGAGRRCVSTHIHRAHAAHASIKL